MAEIKFIDGDVLSTDAELIAHQINASGGFGSGVAGAIRKKYPEIAEEYFRRYTASEIGLGKCYVWKTKTGVKIGNICAQYSYGYDGGQYTSYDALWNGLIDLSRYCVENNIRSIALPYGMSSVRGGANWDVVLQMIKSAFESLNITIKIYRK